MTNVKLEWIKLEAPQFLKVIMSNLIIFLLGTRKVMSWKECTI